jgi:hypothetical protein
VLAIVIRSKDILAETFNFSGLGKALELWSWLLQLSSILWISLAILATRRSCRKVLFRPLGQWASFWLSQLQKSPHRKSVDDTCHHFLARAKERHHLRAS